MDSAGGVTELTHAELVRRVECERETQTAPLPLDTNARVSAAVAAIAGQTGPKPDTLGQRQRDNQVTRYVNRELGQLRLDDGADPSYLRRLETLRATFNGELPVSVNQRIRALMNAGTTGPELVQALTQMQGDLPQAEGGSTPQASTDEPTRVVCSMGILASTQEVNQ